VSIDLTLVRALFLAAFLLAYLGGAAFYVLLQDRMTYWTVGYWLAAAVIIVLAPTLIAGIAAIV
jgi:hypothetical protein